MTTNERARGRLRCAFVGDQSLVIRCAEEADRHGLDVCALASRNTDVLQRCTVASAETVHLNAPGDLADVLRGRDLDVLFSVAFLDLIPADVLAQVPLAINFHDGPLPAYAGLNVTSWAIANGESEHAVTWHLMIEQADAGAVVGRATFPIEPDETALSLNARCFEVGAETFAELAGKLARGELTTEPQGPGQGVLYRRHQRPVTVVDPNRPAHDNARAIRSLELGDRVVNVVGSPHLVVDDRALVVGDVRVEQDAVAPPGTLVSDRLGGFRLSTVDGDLLIGRISDAAGAAVDVSDTWVASPSALLATLVDADPALSEHEPWWRSQLAQTSAPPLTLPLSPEIESVEVLGRDIDPAVVLLATAIVMSAHSDIGTVSLEVVDATVAELMRRLTPLVRPPRLVLDIQIDATVVDATEWVRTRLAESLLHGPFLADLIGRDPQLEPSPPTATVLLDADRPSSSPDGLVVNIGGGSVEMRGPVENQTLQSLGDELRQVVTALCERPGARIADVEIVTPRDRSLLDQLNATATDSDRSTTIDAQFRRQVDATPDLPAVSCAGVTVSYAELAARVDEFATRLIAFGVETGDLVGVALPRSIDLSVSVLAVLTVGAAYLPLDPDYPSDRIDFMLTDSGSSVVIANAPLVGGANVRRIEPGAVGATSPLVAGERRPGDLACVIYTSGSTGRPKGVQLEHAQVCNFFTGMDAVIDHDEPGVWLAVTSLSFDISVLELVWTMTRGFHVVVKQSSGFRPEPRRSRRAPTLSLFHFAAGGDHADDGYHLLLESARWADSHGFEAVWTPERHFHDFGAPYPNPSVTAAAVAVVTKHVGIRAGSVVLPLHSPVRVAEEWSVVDNLSAGRVAISFAAGWQPNDFVLNPSGYASARDSLSEQIETVQRLWRGDTVTLPGPHGDVAVRTLPRPVQPELPVWLTSAGSPASFERAGTLGVNVLTHLLGQTIEQLTANIVRYRSARQEAGHDGSGRVTLMVHTLLDDDGDVARETAREPLTDYLGTAVGLLKNLASAFPTFRSTGPHADEAFRSLSEDETRQLLQMATDRYLSTSGLFGTIDEALAMIGVVTEAGVDEVACLIDFGVDTQVVLPALELLGTLHDRLRAHDGIESLASADETVGSLIEAHGVTHLQCTPSLASMLTADPNERAALASLTHMMVGGEALPLKLARELRAALSGRLTNMYGPTETTIWSLVHEVSDTPETVPIGTPIANTTVHVLDRHGRQVPVGVLGELHIGGKGVARGYLGRPELTAERFVDRPGLGRLYATGDLARIAPSGVVEFGGRRDGQVKIRGHRIEVGEIEAVLDRHTDVQRSVVVAQGEDEPVLSAFVVATTGRAFDESVLREHLLTALPDAMVPSRIRELDALPLTPNGKVDRAKLPTTATRPPIDVAVGGSTEELVAAAWSGALGVPVGRHDNFFDIGGHSLLAVKVFRQVADRTGAAISLTDVFRFPTVQQFALHVDSLMQSSRDGRSPATDAPGGRDRGNKRRRALTREARP